MNTAAILQCPITKSDLKEITKDDFGRFGVSEDYLNFGTLTSGFVDASETYFYPVFNEVIILLPAYALPIGTDSKTHQALSFDKKRVFDYYNTIDYQVKGAYTIYEDSAKWVDYRPVAEEYIRASFRRAADFYPTSGKLFLDIASGPIGAPEYMNLSDGYEYRVCVDISVNALLQAKRNIDQAGKKGIFVCGDITNIPLKPEVFDTVLSQHTLYHIPKKEQLNAVNELHRVAKKGGQVVIIYSWFYHSWFMNISLHVVQLVRILRYFASKLYVRFFPSKPRLYFYPHSPRWFKKSFSFSEDISFHSWRSTNKTFLKMYAHDWLFGKQLLGWLQKMERKHSQFMGRFGDYAAIVIKKK